MTVALQPVELGWVKGPEDDPSDLCAHSPVLFRVDDTVFVTPEDGEWTVSATALYLLRSLREDHVPGTDVTVSDGNQLFPCCAFNGMPGDGDHAAILFGCPNGLDVRLEHADGTVNIRSDRGSVSVSLGSWAAAVKRFVDSVVGFHGACRPKLPIEDDELRATWEAFWEELARRRFDAAVADGTVSIRTPEQIAEVFSTFHDGGIDGMRSIGPDVELGIEADYLAARVDASFSRFHLRLHDCPEVRFVPWPEEGRSRLPSIVEHEAVEGLDLEILSATVEGSTVRVLCLAHAGGESIRGGVLELAASGATVFDERRRPMTLATLVEIRDGYWKEWSESAPGESD